MAGQGKLELHEQMVKVLRDHPEGLDTQGIQKLLGIPFQQHFDRRIRELYPKHIIERRRDGRRTLYCYVSPKAAEARDAEAVTQTQRARILTRDNSRCQMCGKTVAEDHVKLHIDHRIPLSWGGETEDDNLWTLCSACNEGKKNYYATFTDDLMQLIVRIPSVHARIAELLHLKLDEWVDCDLIEFIANVDSGQTDWRKRLRELRYFGLVIKTKRDRRGKRTISQYKLENWVQLPDDPSRAAQVYERERARRNKAGSPS